MDCIKTCSESICLQEPQKMVRKSCNMYTMRQNLLQSWIWISGKKGLCKPRVVGLSVVDGVYSESVQKRQK